GEQTYFVVSAPRRFAFREFDQRATDPLPVKARVHGDVIEKQMIGVRNEYQNPFYVAPVLYHPSLVRQNVLAVVVQHRRRWLADTLHIFDVCVTNDPLDFRQVVDRGGSDTAGHNMPLFERGKPPLRSAAVAAGT